MTGLVKRRASLAGGLEASRAKVRQLHAGTAAVDAAVRQLDPAYPVDAVATKRPRGAAGDVAGFETGRTVLDVPRRAGGSLTIAQVAGRIVALRGLDAASGAVLAMVEGSAGRALRHLQDKSAVRNPDKRGRAVLREVVG